ncbi:MAG: hypothetical protein OXI01_13805 [Albidovulum sp.]|nr:hypothetical protein [Albidovulum sp.]
MREEHRFDLAAEQVHPVPEVGAHVGTVADAALGPPLELADKILPDPLEFLLLPASAVEVGQGLGWILPLVEQRRRQPELGVSVDVFDQSTPAAGGDRDPGEPLQPDELDAGVRLAAGPDPGRPVPVDPGERGGRHGRDADPDRADRERCGPPRFRPVFGDPREIDFRFQLDRGNGAVPDLLGDFKGALLSDGNRACAASPRSRFWHLTTGACRDSPRRAGGTCRRSSSSATGASPS